MRKEKRSKNIDNINTNYNNDGESMMSVNGA
jgi:hypothetical protein